MITEEERQSIINEAVEKALLALPNVVGNLMVQQATYARLNSEFYAKHPEFKQHKEVVMASIEHIDSQFPLLDYKEKLKRAVPEIRRRISMKESLNMSEAKRPAMAKYEGPIEAVRPSSNLGEI